MDEIEGEALPYYGFMPKLGEMPGWFARHNPYMAGCVISEVTGEAERKPGFAGNVTEQSIRVSLDGRGPMHLGTACR